jgi:hypothetical protein
MIRGFLMKGKEPDIKLGGETQISTQCVHLQETVLHVSKHDSFCTDFVLLFNSSLHQSSKIPLFYTTS